jgi:hypothetical protein
MEISEFFALGALGALGALVAVVIIVISSGEFAERISQQINSDLQQLANSLSLYSIINVACFLGPWLLPRALAFYRSVRNPPASQVRPAPPAVKRALNILSVIVLFSLLRSAIPALQAPNIFTSTNSRLGLAGNLIFKKLSTLRDGQLSPLDLALQDKFEDFPGNDIRYLYAAYGPNPIAECVHCSPKNPSSYLYYLLASIVQSHVVHIGILGFITSSFFSGNEGSRWRTWATIAGIALAMADIMMVWNYDWEANKKVRMLNETDFFYWRLHNIRYICFALCDALFGFALYLTSTNRWLVEPPTVSQRLNDNSAALASALHSITILNDQRSAAVRDPVLRREFSDYWDLEGTVMQEVESQKEVVQAKNVAVSRIDMVKVNRDATAILAQSIRAGH